MDRFELDEEEEYEIDEQEDEHNWTTEDYKQMDLLYERYTKEIVSKYGPDWEEKYELVVNKVEIYEAYLKFEERKAKENHDHKVRKGASYR